MDSRQVYPQLIRDFHKDNFGLSKRTPRGGGGNVRVGQIQSHVPWLLFVLCVYVL